MKEATKVEQHPELQSWLMEFASAVRDRNYEPARELFHVDVTGFGTVSDRYVGIDELQQQQWQPVWDRTEGFEFDLAETDYWADGELHVVITVWSSVGVAADGGRRLRRGRATLVLSESVDGFKALHTHFSMAPGSVA